MYWALYIKIVDKTVKHKHNFRSDDAVCMFILGDNSKFDKNIT